MLPGPWKIFCIGFGMSVNSGKNIRLSAWHEINTSAVSVGSFCLNFSHTCFGMIPPRNDEQRIQPKPPKMSFLMEAQPRRLG
jgi:hypothetical protein